MKIYKLLQDVDNYKGCYLKNPDFDEKLELSFNSGKNIDNAINTIDFVFDNSNYILGDVYACFDISAFIINERSQKIFSDDNRIKAQFIKISQAFIIFNNLLVLDVLDQEKTIYKYVLNNIFGIKEYHFIDYDYPPLFQIVMPNKLVQRDYFVTEEFIKTVEENNLKGFLFEEIWDSKKR